MRYNAEKILEIFNKIFKVVEVKEVENFRDKRLGDEDFKIRHRWSDEEYRVLLNFFALPPKMLHEMLGRTWLSVNIKRGQAISEFDNWRRISKKPEPTLKNITRLIEEFLEYKRKEKLRVRRKKKSMSRQMEELEEERGAILNDIKTLKFWIRINTPYHNLTVEKLKSLVEEKKEELRDIENKLDELEKKES